MSSWSWRKKGDFLYRLFCPKKVFLAFAFISIHSLLNTLSEYTYFYISKNITSYTFLLVFKIVESLQCILKLNSFFIFCFIYLLWLTLLVLFYGVNSKFFFYFILLWLIVLSLTWRIYESLHFTTVYISSDISSGLSVL